MSVVGSSGGTEPTDVVERAKAALETQRAQGDPFYPRALLSELVAEVERLRSAQIITTQNQLDALPFLSVIREVFRNSPSGANYGGLYERRTSGWQCVAGTYKDAPDNGAPQLPCRVLYNPRAGVQ